MVAGERKIKELSSAIAEIAVTRCRVPDALAASYWHCANTYRFRWDIVTH